MHKTKKKFKSRRRTQREEARLKLSEAEQKEIKDIENKIDDVEYEHDNATQKANDKIRELKQRVNILDNPHLVKAAEMVNFVESKFREVFKDILSDERFKHIDEDEFELSVSYGHTGKRLYIDFNMETSMTPEEEEEEIKDIKNLMDENDDWGDDDDDEPDEEDDEDDDDDED